MNIKMSVNPQNKVMENGCLSKEIHPGWVLLISLVEGTAIMPGREQEKVVAPSSKKNQKNT
jgi:hypothetical protein